MSGSIEEIIFPLWPAGLKGHGDFISGPFLPWKLEKFSSPGSGWPSRLSSSGL
jgi:hypothetical protein